MAYTTRRPLLNEMRKNNDAAWREFLSTYSPLIRLIARQYRLTDEETDELIQDVCVAMIQRDALGKYDEAQGRFRTYLGRIVSNCAIDLMRRRPVPTQSATERFNNIPAEQPSQTTPLIDDGDEILLQMAMEDVRSRCDDLTFMAFEFHIRQNRPAKEVAQALGVSEQNVYLSSSRIVKRIKAAVERLQKQLDKQ